MNDDRLYDVYRVETLEGLTRFTYVSTGETGKLLIDRLVVRVYGIVIGGEGLNWDSTQNRIWELENSKSHVPH